MDCLRNLLSDNPSRVNLTSRLRRRLVFPSDERKNSFFSFSFKGMGANAPIAPKKQKKKGGEKMEKLELLEELEEEPLHETETDNAYIINKLKSRGHRILMRHLFKTAKFAATIASGDASPVAERILNRNEGSAPESVFRTYCPECRKVRTLVVVPARSETELRASCEHILNKAVDAARRDRTLVFIGRYRVVPAGVAKLIGEKVLG